MIHVPVNSRRVLAFLCIVVHCAFPFVSSGASGSNSEKQSVRARQGVVVSADSLASAVGVKILQQGGNAIDAAVAVGFALAVTAPMYGNIGGGGFMVIRFADGRETTFNFREKAPMAVRTELYLDSAGQVIPRRSYEGHLAVGVPGSVAGLLLALERYGKLDRTSILTPAIQLAEKGFVIDPWLSDVFESYKASLTRYPGARRIFAPHGRILQSGDTLRQSDLAETLKRIRHSGNDGFYRGITVDLLVREMQRGGGLITHQDLENYRAVEQPPVRGKYRGFEIVSIAPPSSGGVALINMLNLLEPFDVAKLAPLSPTKVNLVAESMRLAFADRAVHVGDPVFVPVPVAALTSKQYAKQRGALIDTSRATPSVSVTGGETASFNESETTHISVMDQWGNAVSFTTTINSWFGSKVVVEGAGFFLNNEMDDFVIKAGVPNSEELIGTDANAIAPGKQMVSSMTPTIVLKNKKPFLLIGTPGGSTIITTVLQIIINVIDHGMTLRDAIDFPRVHHQWRPDTLYYEAEGLPEGVAADLRRRGYSVIQRSGESGRAEGILFDEASGLMYGVSDRRANGAALGY